MIKDTVTATLSCENCGGVPMTEDSPTDNSIVECQSCGQVFGTYGDLKATVMDATKAQVTSHITTMFEDVFKGVEGITFTKA